MFSVRHLRPADYRRMPWKNGQGWTTEILAAPEGAGIAGTSFDWRISIAEIEAANTFSAFPGYDRALLVLDGSGIVLEIGTRDTLSLRRGQLATFAGEDAVQCALLAGPTRDFNVMTRRGVLEATLLLRPLVGTLVFLAEPGVFWAVFMASGLARVTANEKLSEIASGESLLIETLGATGGERLILDGHGEAVIVRFRRTSAAADQRSSRT